MAATTFTLDNGCLSGDKIRVSVLVSAWDYSFYKQLQLKESQGSQERNRGREIILRIRNVHSCASK